MHIQGTLALNSPVWNHIGAKANEALRICGTFIYETPVWVVAATIIGIAFAFFYHRLAAPFLGIAGAAVLSRIVVKIIDRYQPELLKEWVEQIYEFQRKHIYLHYLAFIISLATAIVCPLGSAVFAAAIGIYRGMVMEIDIFKHKQVKKIETYHADLSDWKLNMINN